ncbi:MAG: tyrosine-type recombinase/integrase [Rhodomicrobium sp.]
MPTFFCNNTLGQPELGHRLARKLPRVLSPEEVVRLLEAAPRPGLKYKAALSVAYGTGWRALEVCMLRVSDIDSQRMVIRVELGKGGKDRFAMLSPQLLPNRANTFVERVNTVQPALESIFLPDSYGYRPGKSALDPVGVTPVLSIKNRTRSP